MADSFEIKAVSADTNSPLRPSKVCTQRLLLFAECAAPLGIRSLLEMIHLGTVKKIINDTAELLMQIGIIST